MKYGTPTRKYSETVRQFCMGLEYLSPAAYRYVRRVFNKNMPAPRTLRRWYRSIDAEPGITSVSLDILKKKAEEYKQKGKELLLALLCDEVSIKKSVIWNEAESKFDGFVSCENTSEQRRKKRKKKKNADHLDVAKDALVFMCVGEDFKIVVAYFFLCGLEAVNRAALTQEVIRSVNGAGAKVMSFTVDGTITNISCAKNLGVNFRKDKPFFKSPTSPHYNIYFLLDAPHMLKLARGCFASHQLYFKGKPIRWKFVADLHNMQKIRNLNLGNKLTNLHINYHLKPMNVRLAAEVMSNSTAHCIDQLCEDDYEAFQNSYETTQFIRHVNNVFDICNVQANKPPSGYKQPICESNAEELFQYFHAAKKYFQSIEIDEQNWNSKQIKRKLAIRSRSMTPFLGMVHNLTALQGLYNDYIVTGQLIALFSFQCSQDHLETWFSCIRRGLGSNDNPTATDFRRLYRKLLVCHEITYDGNKANCISNETGILTVSSDIFPQPTEKLNMNEIPELEFNYHEVMNEELEKFDEHLNVYAASRVELTLKRNIQTHKEKCMSCIQVFQENEIANDNFIARKKISNQPCISTVDIIKASNKIMHLLPNQEFNIGNLSLTILKNLDCDVLYIDSDFEDHDSTEPRRSPRDQMSRMSHKDHFLYNVVKAYMHIKAHRIGAKIADEERGVYIRHTNKKLIHIAGQ